MKMEQAPLLNPKTVDAAGTHDEHGDEPVFSDQPRLICSRCGRRLKKVYNKLGMGPTCYRKYGGG